MTAKRKSLIIIAVSASISVLGAHALQAQQAPAKKPADPKAKFEKLDTDKNGSLSPEEFSAKSKNPERAKKVFAKIDTNSDGSISPEEMAAAPKPKGGAKGKPKQKPKKKAPAGEAAAE